MSKNVKFDFSDFEKFQKKLENLSKQDSVPLEDLFSSSFMSKNTNFSNSDDFFNACNIHTDEDLKQIPDAEMDKLVAQHTKFSSWQEMLDTSVAEYTKKKLGF